MTIETDKHKDWLIVRYRKASLDAVAANAFKEVLMAIIDEGYEMIVLDLSEVEFIDSRGLGAILVSWKHLGKTGEMVLCGMKGSVASLLSLSRIDKILTIYTDINEVKQKL